MIAVALGIALAATKIVVSTNSLVPSTPSFIHHTNTPPTSIMISNVMEIGNLNLDTNINNKMPLLLFTTNLGKSWQLETNWDYFPVFTNVFSVSNFITHLVTNVATNYITNMAKLRYNIKTNGINKFFKLEQQ